MAKKRLILRYLKKFLLSILILLTTITVLTRLTILNRSFVEKQFTNTHYKNVEESLKTKMKESMISSGISDTVIDTMFTENDIKKTTEATLDIIYNYNKQNLDTTNIRNNLEENINKYLQENNYVATNEEGYKNFIDSIMEIYDGEFIMLNKISTVGIYMDKIIKVTTILAIMLCVVTFVIVALRYKKMPKYLPTALFTTSFVMSLGANYIYYHAGLSSITIISQTFSDILRKVINSTFNTFYLVSIVYIIIGIMLCFFVHRHRHHRHHH